MQYSIYTGIVIYRLSNQANSKLLDLEVHIFPQRWWRETRNYSVNLVHYYNWNLCSISFSCVQYAFHSFSGFCPDLLPILNGRVIHTGPSISQASVEFRCNENFRLVGRSRLECIDGRWNGNLPFCESKSPLQYIARSYQNLPRCRTWFLMYRINSTRLLALL